jgi:P4 family phage/plasmid primase-like protien
MAEACLSAGISFIPIRPDGSKAPALPTWDVYKIELPLLDEAEDWFADGRRGIAVIGGGVSRNLLIVDIEYLEDFETWRSLVETIKPGLTARLPIVQTPGKEECGGRHVYVRTAGAAIKSQKLARMTREEAERRTGDPGKTTVAETKGEGGYVLATGCPAACHESGRLYRHIAGPPITEVPTLAEADVQILLDCARALERGDKASEDHHHEPASTEGYRPGDEFNARSDWLRDVLPEGWRVVRQNGEVLFLCRPGKPAGVSATIGFCRTKRGDSKLHVFTTNAEPFEADKSYSKFEAFAVLRHNGDFSAAAKALADAGYGDPPRSRATSSPTTPTGAAKDGGDFLLNDGGNALRVLAEHGQDLRYCHPQKLWYPWNGQLWAKDRTAQVFQCIERVQTALYTMAQAQLNWASEADAKAYWKELRDHARRWGQTAAMDACEKAMRRKEGVPVVPEDFDRDPFLLTVLNGTIDLKTGLLREHRRADLITKLSPVGYDPDAPCPLWMRCLDRWMEGKQRLITYLQRVAGYGLTGDVSEQVIFFFHGPGANGKSTALLTLLGILGDYGMQAVPELLLQKRHESHPTERADLHGRRFVATIETDEGKKLAEALLKQLTGGDRIRARFLFQDFFEFLPAHKIILAANHRPVVSGTDWAVWRRIKLVPWTVVIPENEKDKQLSKKLRAEWPGILAWMVRGCLDWQRNGMEEPEEVHAATEEYRAEQNVVAAFIRECCLKNKEVSCSASDLYDAYVDWTGDKDMTKRKFGQRLEGEGLTPDKGTGGIRLWKGIGLDWTKKRPNSGGGHSQ